MKKIFKLTAAVLTLGVSMTSCIEEILPQDSTVTIGQAASAPGSFENFVAGLTSNLTGSFVFGSSNTYPYDFGYPSFFIQRDVMGNDMTIDSGDDWFQSWYSCGVALGPQYLVCQLPMTYFYGWINDCNKVIAMAGDTPDESKLSGSGIAHAMRAMFYMDIAQMFAREPYTANKQAATAPLRTDKTATQVHMARATNEEMYNFIIEDLNIAEQHIAGYKRTDKTTPDLSVVYGLKARAYLLMGEWAEAEKYAKLAQEGYTMLSESEYLSRTTGFNSPDNGSWMFCVTCLPSDPNILLNDADSSWGSHMILEVNASGCGYASNYGRPKRIDAHLYATIPATDFRKKLFIDPSVDSMEGDELVEALGAYTDSPADIIGVGKSSDRGEMAHLSVKFRPNGGVTDNQYKGFEVSIPLMRVEEMKLIEIEAAGMQDENRGKQLLEAFAKTRDANYTFGTHTDAYNNNTQTTFQNEVWWQRRVELWGEGFATYDIKRLQKGIIRSYAGSNHVDDYMWNTNEVPSWMTYCFVQTESNYNNLLEQNPTPIHESGNDPEFIW